MITFFTTRPHPISHPEIVVTSNLSSWFDWAGTRKAFGLDTEFNGLNPLYAIPFMLQLGNASDQFIFDLQDEYITVDLKENLTPYLDKLFVGHNIKIDLEILRFHFGIDIRNVYDTMVTEQRLGLDSKRPNDLEAVYHRRTGNVMFEKKKLQKSFSTMRKDDLYLTEQIIYAAGDISVLPAIKKDQERLIAKFDMFRLIDIENHIIPVLVDMELEGFHINEEKWRENINNNKLKLIQIERELDEILVNLGVITQKKERELVEVVQGSLFGELIEEKTTRIPQKSQINYGSSDQVLKIFELCDLPYPTEISNTKDKITGVKVYEEKESSGEPALNKFLIEHPHTVLQDFIIKLLEQRGIEKELNSFGERFLEFRVKKTTATKPGEVKADYSRIIGSNYSLGFKNLITGKVHTTYKQCFTSTGRLSSGDSRNGFYNSQQIPAVPRFREAFTLSQQEIEDDWWITSCDLQGAETMFVCAFAKDEQLYKWAVEEDDVHSPLATACWRAVYEYRKRKNRSLLVKSLVEDKQGNYPIIELTPDIIITKKINEPFRRYFKNNTFAVFYQAKAQTVGKTLNIPVDEAQIMINVFKSLLPKTFAMIEEAIAFALAKKYLVFNTRTNSRKYFMTGNAEAIRGEAANCRIQGSQADAVKEAMWNIDTYFRDSSIPYCQLLQVHDELVIKHKGKEHYKAIQSIMADTATLYLEGFTTMKAEASVGHTWIK